MMDLSSLTGIESDTTLLRLTTIIIGIGGLLYARFGGAFERSQFLTLSTALASSSEASRSLGFQSMQSVVTTESRKVGKL